MGHEINHFLHVATHIVKDLGPLSKKKNPLIAFCLGFCFGAFGIGLYLWSWKDFGICIALGVMLTLALYPTGPGMLLGIPGEFLLSACYGAYRVTTSNEAGHYY